MGQLMTKFNALSPAAKGAWAFGIAAVLAGLIILILWLAGVLFQDDDATAAPTSTTTTQSETTATVTPTATA